MVTSYRTEVTHEVKVGETVLYVDAEARTHEALVTTIFDRGDGHTAPSINVVHVTEDESADDQYGRQIVRATSVVHKSQQAAHGMYWKEAH